MKIPAIVCIVLATTLWSACGSSGNDTVSTADSANEAKADTAQEQGTMSTVAEEDSKFAVEAASGGMAEVELGKLAQEKASDAKVKEFGTMMVNDHSKANEELKALAAQKNITLPAAPGEDELKTISDISARTGKDFDKAYVTEMVRDHEQDVKMFEDALTNVKDAELRQFIEKTLPVLRSHLDHINQLSKAKY